MSYALAEDRNAFYAPADRVGSKAHQKYDVHNDFSAEYERLYRQAEILSRKHHAKTVRVDEIFQAITAARAMEKSPKTAQRHLVSENMISALWPTISFAIGIVAIMFAVIYGTQKEFVMLVPAAFASVVFAGMGFLAIHVRRQVKRACRSALMTN